MSLFHRRRSWSTRMHIRIQSSLCGWQQATAFITIYVLWNLLWFHFKRMHTCDDDHFMRARWTLFRRIHRVNIWFDKIQRNFSVCGKCAAPLFVFLLTSAHQPAMVAFARHLIKRTIMWNGGCNQSNWINICSSGERRATHSARQKPPPISRVCLRSAKLHCLRETKNK